MQTSDTEPTDDSGDADLLVLMQTVRSWMQSGVAKQVQPPEKVDREIRMVVIEYMMESKESRVTLRPGEVKSFGRSSGVDHRVPLDPCLSGQHFSIRCESDGGIINDLGSSNGTFVNGERVIQADLRDGDTIVAGMTLFRFGCSYM